MLWFNDVDPAMPASEGFAANTGTSQARIQFIQKKQD
jgi:hypothetical protein